MFKRLLLSLIVVLLFSFSIFAQNEATFETAPCPVEIPYGIVEDTGAGAIECGFVNVPEFHAEPDGNQIRVAVAIIHANTPNPAPDPVYIEQGGPGGSTIEAFVPLASLFPQIFPGRDIILVEQRGTKYSEPALTCPESLESAFETISEDLSEEEALAIQGGIFQTCYERLLSEGVNLSAYNSVENAADMIDVADALGYEQINFFGLSYGTMLGQHLLRDHEDRVRSMILDAVVPLEQNFVPDALKSASDALNALFASCAEDEFCNSHYPDLETRFEQVYANLNANPILLPVIDPETGDEYDAFFDGDIMLQYLRFFLYQTPIIPSIPAFIDAASKGDFGWMERLYSMTLNLARDTADGMFISVMCAEDADFTEEDIVTEGVRQEFVESTGLSVFLGIGGACDLAQVDVLDDYVDDPVVSDVPVLLLSGNFDPITPLSYAETVASHLPNSTSVFFPTTGHGALVSGFCPLNIIASFVTNPEATVNSSCIDTMVINYTELTTDPTGRLQFAKPNGFTDLSTDTYASYENENTQVRISVIGIENTDVRAAIDDALSIVIREGFETPPTIEATENTAFGEAHNVFYIEGTNYIVTYAFAVGDLTSVIIIELPLAQVANLSPMLQSLVVNMFPVD